MFTVKGVEEVIREIRSRDAKNAWTWKNRCLLAGEEELF